MISIVVCSRMPDIPSDLKKNIKDFNLEQLKTELIALGEKPFRAEQIFKWIYLRSR